MDVHGTGLAVTIHARSVCQVVAMIANKVRAVVGLRAGGERERYARSLTLRSLVYLALLVVPYPLSASGGIFGEGYSSPAPGAPAGISFHASTIYTGQDACAKSAVPSEQTPLRASVRVVVESSMRQRAAAEPLRR